MTIEPHEKKGTAPKLGVYVNNRAAVFLGEGFTLSDLIDLAVSAEDAGLDFVSVGDSLLAKPRYSPIVVLAGIAAVTKQIELTTGILQPHMRNPVMLAQEWATLDVLCGGRTSLGVGLGTGPLELVEAEYRLIGIPKRKRGVAFDEAITLLRQLWTEPEVTFSGEVFQIDSATVGFSSARRPHPPILVACGGYVPEQAGTGPNDFYSPETAGTFTGPFERVVRLGDGWITGIVTPDEYRRALGVVDALAQQRGRTLDDGFERRLNCFLHIGPDAAQARQVGQEFLESYHRLPFDSETLDRWLIAGTAEACAEQISAYVDAGVTSFQFVLADHQQQRQLERLANDLAPRVRDNVTVAAMA
jgi:alkanesulfonate monooxygenase SsuD/methylene tetrahydromethanopterin reductase-like flavin-dependent oxidoreductase (luciferase family)